MLNYRDNAQQAVRVRYLNEYTFKRWFIENNRWSVRCIILWLVESCKKYLKVIKDCVLTFHFNIPRKILYTTAFY